MAVTSLARVEKRVISILMANRLSPYAGVIPTPPSNSRYQSTTEITDAILEADSVIVLARIDTPGDPYRTSFMTATADLDDGDFIIGHVGAQGDVDVAVGLDFKPARFTKSRAELIAIRAHPTLYEDCERWCFVSDGRIYHNGDAARVWYPNFTKTSACQSPEVDELAVIAQTLGSLPKDGAVTPEIYSAGAQYAQWYIATQIKGENAILPEAETIERQLAA